jgi:hypothetical protein
MVPKTSAVVVGMRDAEAVEIRKDHTTLVKFGNSSDDDFQTVVGHLSLMCEKAAEKVAQNWEHWEEIKGVQSSLLCINGASSLLGVFLADSSEALNADTWLNDFKIPLLVSHYRNPSFIGRTQDLNHMHSFLECVRQKKRPSVPLVVHGTGGIGKTQLVREFVFAHRDEFSSIDWIDARNAHNVRNGFAAYLQKLLDCYVEKSRVTPPPYHRIALYLGISELVDKDGCITADSSALDLVVSACLQWFDRAGNTHWLLVFDNVDDLDSFDVSDFFPKTMQGSTIITSRRPECSQLGKGWKLQSMELGDSISLLSKRYGREIKEDDGGTASSYFLTFSLHLPAVTN